MQSDEFDWGDAKAEANLRKHEISFREASRVFDDAFAVRVQDFTQDYGEDRFVATGLLEDVLAAVAYKGAR
jgi:uncharacterized DUF497 family protein